MKISVLLTTYNCEGFIYTAVRSMLNQTFTDFELIIVDDGSNDSTENIVGSIIDERIKYYKIEHVRRSKALNYGLTKCDCDWVALMDSDDICHPQRLEIELKTIADNPEIDIISSWYGIFKSNKLLYINKTPEYDNFIKKSLLLHSVISNPCVIFRKQLIINAGGYDSRYEDYWPEDYSLWLRLINKATFYNIQQTLIFQRYRSDSISRKNLQRTMDRIYELQAPYIQIHSKDLSGNEKYILLGWREYFYGKKTQVFKYWKKLSLKILLKPKILYALFTLLLPGKFFIKFKELRIRYRVEYIISYFSAINKESRKTFDKLLSINNSKNKL